MKIKDSDITNMFYKLSKPTDSGYLVPLKFSKQLLKRFNQTQEYVDSIYERYDRRYKWRLKFNKILQWVAICRGKFE